MQPTVVLAHAGGAPEVLTVGLPILVFAGFVLAEKRARARERGPHEPDDADDALPEDDR